MGWTALGMADLAGHHEISAMLRKHLTWVSEYGPNAITQDSCVRAVQQGCWRAFGSQAGPSMQGCDGIHPRGGTHAAARHGELGAQLAVAAALAMANHTL